jgi:hypothetical protein
VTQITSIHGLSGLTAITLGVALSMTAGLALAGDNNVSADQILKSALPNSRTAGIELLLMPAEL